MVYMFPAAKSLFFNANLRGNVNDVKYEHDCTYTDMPCALHYITVLFIVA